MANLGVNPEAVFPYQMLFHGKNADADYLNFIAQLAKIINKHAPDLIRKVGTYCEPHVRAVFDVWAYGWEWLSPKEPTSFFGRLWSYITAATKRVVTYLISNPWLVVAIIVLIVVVWILYQARHSPASQGAPHEPHVN